MANVSNRRRVLDPTLPKRRYKVASPKNFAEEQDSALFVSNLNKELAAITLRIDQFPALTRAFNPADYIKRVDLDDALADLDEIDLATITPAGEEGVGGRGRRGRRTSRRRRAIEAAVEAAIQNAEPLSAPPEVEDAGAIGTTDHSPGPTRFALSDHTHSGVNLSDVQTILALKHFSGGIDGGPASTDDMVINSNPSFDGRIILGSDITGTDSVVIHGTETGITIGGTLFETRLAIHDEDVLAQATTLWHKHTNTGTSAPTNIYARSRGTEAAETVVADNDVLGRIIAVGFDGTDHERAAQILFEVDDTTPSGTSMGGAMTFSTTPRNAVAVVERARIHHNGLFEWLNTPSPASGATVQAMRWGPALTLPATAAVINAFVMDPTVTCVDNLASMRYIDIAGTHVQTTVAPSAFQILTAIHSRINSSSNANLVFPWMPDLMIDANVVNMIGNGTSGAFAATTPANYIYIGILGSPTISATNGAALTFSGTRSGVAHYYAAGTLAATGVTGSSLTLPLRAGFLDAGPLVTTNNGGVVTVDVCAGLQIMDYTVGTLQSAVHSKLNTATGKWAWYGEGTAFSLFGGPIVGGNAVGSSIDIRQSRATNYTTGSVRIGAGAGDYGTTAPVLVALWPDGATIGAGASVANAEAVSMSSTITQGGIGLLGLFPVIQLFSDRHLYLPGSSAVTVFGATVSFLSQPTIRNNHTANITDGTYRGFQSAPTFDVTSSGTLTHSEITGFRSAAVINASVVGTVRRGLHVLAHTGSGTTPTVIGVDIETLVGATLACSLRSSGSLLQMRHAGPGVFGANAAPANASVGLEVQSTTRAFLLPRMTTVQRDAMTPVDGMMIYNTTTAVIEGREAGAWVNL